MLTSAAPSADAAPRAARQCASRGAGAIPASRTRSHRRAQRRAGLRVARRALRARRRRGVGRPGDRARSMAGARRRARSPTSRKDGPAEALARAAPRCADLLAPAFPADRRAASASPTFSCDLRPGYARLEVAPVSLYHVTARRAWREAAGELAEMLGTMASKANWSNRLPAALLACAVSLGLGGRRGGGAVAGRRCRQRPDAEREQRDRALVSRLADQADDDLCRAAGGARRAPDARYAADHVGARGRACRRRKWALLPASR